MATTTCQIHNIIYGNSGNIVPANAFPIPIFPAMTSDVVSTPNVPPVLLQLSCTNSNIRVYLTKETLKMAPIILNSFDALAAQLDDILENLSPNPTTPPLAIGAISGIVVNIIIQQLKKWRFQSKKLKKNWRLWLRTKSPAKFTNLRQNLETFPNLKFFIFWIFFSS